MRRTITARFALLFVLLFGAAHVAIGAGQVDSRAFKKKKVGAIRSVWPAYPYEARRRGITGTGIYVVDLDRQGRVTAVHVGASTGSRILDNAALEALKHWRFEPGSPPRLKMPFTWSLPRRVREIRSANDWVF